MILGLQLPAAVNLCMAGGADIDPETVLFGFGAERPAEDFVTGGVFILVTVVALKTF